MTYLSAKITVPVTVSGSDFVTCVNHVACDFVKNTSADPTIVSPLSTALLQTAQGLAPSVLPALPDLQQTYWQHDLTLHLPTLNADQLKQIMTGIPVAAQQDGVPSILAEVEKYFTEVVDRIADSPNLDAVYDYEDLRIVEGIELYADRKSVQGQNILTLGVRLLTGSDEDWGSHGKERQAAYEVERLLWSLDNDRYEERVMLSGYAVIEETETDPYGDDSETKTNQKFGRVHFERIFGKESSSRLTYRSASSMVKDSVGYSADRREQTSSVKGREAVKDVYAHAADIHQALWPKSGAAIMAQEITKKSPLQIWRSGLLDLFRAYGQQLDAQSVPIPLPVPRPPAPKGSLAAAIEKSSIVERLLDDPVLWGSLEEFGQFLEETGRSLELADSLHPIAASLLDADESVSFPTILDQVRGETIHPISLQQIKDATIDRIKHILQHGPLRELQGVSDLLAELGIQFSLSAKGTAGLLAYLSSLASEDQT